jgi:hypothetical protein
MVIMPRAMSEFEIQRAKRQVKKEAKEVHGTNKPKQEKIENSGNVRKIENTSNSNVADIPKTNDRESFGSAIL